MHTAAETSSFLFVFEGVIRTNVDNASEPVGSKGRTLPSRDRPLHKGG